MPGRHALAKFRLASSYTHLVRVLQSLEAKHDDLCYGSPLDSAGCQQHILMRAPAGILVTAELTVDCIWVKADQAAQFWHSAVQGW